MSRHVCAGIAPAIVALIGCLASPGGAAATLPASAFPFAGAPEAVWTAQRAPRIEDGLAIEDGTIKVGSEPFYSDARDGWRLIGARTIRPVRRVPNAPRALFVHWLGDEPQTTNLSEFEPEMKALAKRGVESLAVNAMWAAPKWFEERRSPATDYDASLQQVAALKAAVDVVMANASPATRLAYVGHDFGAMYGALLAAYEPRIAYYVFISGTTSFADWYLLGKKPPDVAAYRLRMAPLDPLPYLAESHGADYFLQFALKDRYVPLERARAFFDAAPAPKTFALYDDDHSMRSPRAVADRIAWLGARLAP